MSDRENRTETPTIKRIGQARAEGKLPAVTLLPGTLFFFAALLAAELAAAGAIARFLVWARELKQTPFEPDPASLAVQTSAGFRPFVPLLLILAAAALLLPALGAWLGRGWSFLPEKAAPDFSRLRPRFGTLFSLNSAWRLAMAAFQITGVLLIIFYRLRSAGDPHSLLSLPPEDWPALFRHELLPLTVLLGLFSLIPAAADLFFQRWKFKWDLRMTPEELRREQREEERKKPF